MADAVQVDMNKLREDVSLDLVQFGLPGSKRDTLDLETLSGAPPLQDVKAWPDLSAAYPGSQHGLVTVVTCVLVT